MVRRGLTQRERWGKREGGRGEPSSPPMAAVERRRKRREKEKKKRM